MVKCSDCRFATVRALPRNGNSASWRSGHFTESSYVCSHPSGKVVLFTGKTSPKNCPRRKEASNE